jgi:hypothetical protein
MHMCQECYCYTELNTALYYMVHYSQVVGCKATHTLIRGGKSTHGLNDAAAVVQHVSKRSVGDA